MEELLLAILGALHNLSFYQDIDDRIESADADGNDDYSDSPSTNVDASSNRKRSRLPSTSVAARLADLSAALCSTLKTGPQAGRIEAARVLGNMTRSPAGRQSLCAAGGLKVLVQNLETTGGCQANVDDANADRVELVATSVGVLVNVLSDWQRRAPFRELRGPFQLRDVLQRAALRGDWLLAGTVCQALWNYLIDTANIAGALGEDEADYIAGDLAEYLDEDALFGAGGQPDERWETDFAMVAADLLERIQASMEFSLSPCVSSSDEDDEKANREEEEADDLLCGPDGGRMAELIGNTWQGQHFRSWLQED